MKKWFLSLILFVTMIFAPLSGVLAVADSSASLRVANVSGTKGSVVSVSVSVSTTENFWSIKLVPSYDTSVLTLQDASSSYQCTSGAATLIESKTLSNDIGSGVLVTYKFKVADDAAVGTYTVSVSVGQCITTEKALSVVGASGSVTVKAATPACSHTPSQSYTSNMYSHWKICTKCNTTLSSSVHNFDEGVVTKPATETEEGEMVYTCGVCSYKKTVVLSVLPEHVHSYQAKYDAENHWTECSCGDKKDVTAHAFDAGVEVDGVITYTCECGYKKVVAAHVHNFEMKYDANNHWSECSCGEKKDESAHIFGSAVEEDGKLVYNCTCGYQKVEEKEGLSAGAVVGIVIGSAVVAGGGGFSVAWFFVLKKSGAELLAVTKGGIAKLIKAIKSLFIK